MVDSMLLLLLLGGLPGVLRHLDGLSFVLVLDVDLPVVSRSLERRHESHHLPAASRHGASAA